MNKTTRLLACLLTALALSISAYAQAQKVLAPGQLHYDHVIAPVAPASQTDSATATATAIAIQPASGTTLPVRFGNTLTFQVWLDPVLAPVAKISHTGQSYWDYAPEAAALPTGGLVPITIDLMVGRDITTEGPLTILVEAGIVVARATYQIHVILDPVKLQSANTKVHCGGPTVVTAMITTYYWATGATVGNYHWLTSSTTNLQLAPMEYKDVTHDSTATTQFDLPGRQQVIYVENGGDLGFCLVDVLPHQ